MNLACILSCVIATVAPGMTQEKDLIGDFTRSPTEHIINQIEQPFVVRSVQGMVIRKEGFREPLAGVLFEIQVVPESGDVKNWPFINENNRTPSADDAT